MKKQKEYKTMLLFFRCFLFIFIIGCAQKNNTEEKSELNEIQNDEVVSMRLSSPAFNNGGGIPSKYTCDSDDVSPPLAIEGVPENAKSLALIMDDPDAMKPAGRVWVHWVVWNIPPDTNKIPEGTEPEGVQGTTDFRRTGYGGPCPPDGRHMYFFKIYALDKELDLPEGSTKADLLGAMKGRIIAQAELTGSYIRD